MMKHLRVEWPRSHEKLRDAQLYAMLNDLKNTGNTELGIYMSVGSLLASYRDGTGGTKSIVLF